MNGVQVGAVHFSGGRYIRRMTRKARLTALLDGLDAQRAALLARIAAAPEALRTRQPAPGQWSAAQVIVHLAMAEEAAVAYLGKKLLFGHHQRPPLTAGLRVLILRMAFASPLKFKAPAFIATIPEVDHATAVARWDAARAALRKAYEALPEERLGQALFKHPFAGRLDLMRGLHTMRIHVRRHAGQVERILTAHP